ncbi:hypothetical protein IHE45_04G145100 [Dioscorea alata]|uniref:Uncharacterized protein n=1 Tax=Dioscorea alata TaxID=55571 RepID=A0ACB7WGT1_DIOAL|nr:hypothetical protein IHE45_04G145100 [Dioscorea alata]
MEQQRFPRPKRISMASSSALSSSPVPPLRSPAITPIPEEEKEDERHTPTPLHPSFVPPKKTTRSTAASDDDDIAVSCNKCRPTSRDKISVVPLDPTASSPSRLFRSIFHSLTRRTPVPSSDSDEWRLAAAELSRKLLHATRRRDEALLEASRLKSSLSHLSRKLDRLESHCLDLQSSLDRCSQVSQSPTQIGSLPVDPFLRAVSDSRSAVRLLSRSLSAHLRPSTPKPLILSLESVLNRVFYSDFETGLIPEPMDPIARCEANRKGYEEVRELGWEEVLSRGTRHYSEGLSRFCDRRMGEIVGMLGWGGSSGGGPGQRAWPEGLLQAFFSAAKGVWLVHLLSRSVHPPVPLLRVNPGARFEPDFMEDAAGSSRVVGPVSVRMMVAPGFYVYSTSCGVVKCKVLYNNNNNNNNNNQGNGDINVSGRNNKKNSGKGDQFM